MVDVPAGYLLKITTWENDADNYSTTEISGLSKEDVPLYLHLASLFRSRNNRRKGIGNGKVLDPMELTEIICDHFDIASLSLPSDLRKGADDDTDEAWEHRLSNKIYELIGIWNEGEMYRVFESAEIFFVEIPVKNVTSEFIL